MLQSSPSRENSAAEEQCHADAVTSFG